MTSTATPPSDAVGFLGTIPLFKTLPAEALRDLAAATVEREYPGGAAIIRRVDPADGLYMVLAGLVQVVADEDGASGARVLSVLGPGEAFGELSLLDGKPRSASVVAAWKSRCLFLPREAFQQHLERYPSTALALLQVLVARLRETDRRLAQSS